MANEITKLDGDTRLGANVLFLFDVIPGSYTADGGATTVVPETPSSELPAIAANILPAAEKAELDAGTKVFKVIRLSMEEGKTGSDLLAAARAKYAKMEPMIQIRINEKYRWIGTRADK